MNKRQQGVALIEFALILPFLLLLLCITVEVGRAIWQYDTLTKAVRDSARYLSTKTPNDPVAITKARNLIVYGKLEAGGDPLVPGLEEANVPDPKWDPAGSEPVINAVTIRITGYTFVSMFTGLPFGNITFNDISATMRSYK